MLLHRRALLLLGAVMAMAIMAVGIAAMTTEESHHEFASDLASFDQILSDYDSSFLESSSSSFVSVDRRHRHHHRAAPVHRPAPVRHVHRPAPVHRAVRHVVRAIHRHHHHHHRHHRRAAPVHRPKVHHRRHRRRHRRHRRRHRGRPAPAPKVHRRRRHRKIARAVPKVVAKRVHRHKWRKGHKHRHHKRAGKQNHKKAKASRASDTAYVTSLYNSLLCRAPESAGLNGWVNGLQSNALTRAQVHAGFLNSPEYKGRGGRPCPRGGRAAPARGAAKPPRAPAKPARQENFEPYVQSLYRSILCRKGEPTGVTGWVNALKSKTMNKAQVRSAFLTSPEYKSRKGRPCGSPQAKVRQEDFRPFVESLYNTLLCRHSEPSGLAGWVNALKSGALTKEKVRQGFLTSPEYRNRRGRPCGSQAAQKQKPHATGRPKPPPPPAPPAPKKIRGEIVVPKPLPPPESPTGYKNRYITDWGYSHNRHWVDARGVGVKEDYGRWVGDKGNVWYSVALKDCPNQYSGRLEWIWKNGAVVRGPKFKSAECSSRRSVTPPKRIQPATPPPVKIAAIPKKVKAAIIAAQNGIRGQSAEVVLPTGKKVRVPGSLLAEGIKRGLTPEKVAKSLATTSMKPGHTQKVTKPDGPDDIHVHVEKIAENTAKASDTLSGIESRFSRHHDRIMARLDRALRHVTEHIDGHKVAEYALIEADADADAEADADVSNPSVPIVDGSGSFASSPQVDLSRFKVQPVIDATLVQDATLTQTQ